MVDVSLRERLKPGVRVKVIQQIAARDYTLTNETVGTLIDYRQRQTGSWYAHSKNDKLWLDRLTIKKADGEITTLNLDDYSAIQILDDAADASAAKQNETDLPV